VSYVGSDDSAICDICTQMFPAGYPDRFYEPWTVTAGPVLVGGRLTADRRDTFALCESCLQSLILEARLPIDGRELAIESRDRWLASQKLLSQAEDVVRGRSPRRLAG
jgi:hypothetical protein